MEISLTREHEELIRRKLHEGGYASASDVVRDALGLLEEREQLRQIRIARLQKEVAAGLASLNRGEGIDGDAVFAEIRRRSLTKTGESAA
jgi:antitoxin ParD1/3/4